MLITPDKFLRGQHWLKDWAGQWDLFICFYTGADYTTLLKKEMGINFDKCLFIYQNGFVDCYLNKRCLDNLGKAINDKVEKNVSWIDNNCKTLRKNSKVLLDYYKRTQKSRVDEKMLQKFLRLLSECFAFYTVNKLCFDYLPPDILKKKLHTMEAARLYAEPVYTVYLALIQRWGKQMEKEVGLPKDLLLSCKPDEVWNYYDTGKLPSRVVLEDRFKFNVLLSQSGNNLLLTGKQAKIIEKKIFNSFVGGKELKGTCAYPGKVKGKVRIVFDPAKVKNFKIGEILVTPMTRPEYLSLIKKSAGFITDAGGMLSHASITARELGKPCIVGTQLATKKLKDGQLVEMDAGRGIIKRIN